MSCRTEELAKESCCPKHVPTQGEIFFSQYYSCASAILNQYMNTMVNSEYFGKPTKSQQYTDAINDIHALFGYLYIIYMEMAEDASKDPCGQPKPISYYYTTHKIECIKSYYACRGYNVNPLLAVFGLENGNNPVSLDGINFMCLESCLSLPGCSSNNQVFIINKP
jgi:hypothetical protein